MVSALLSGIYAKIHKESTVEGCRSGKIRKGFIRSSEGIGLTSSTAFLLQFMALIKSISGIRGTIGGAPGSGLTPIDIVRFTTAYGAWIAQGSGNKKIIVGRDGRISGEMVRNIVVSTLQGLGFDVVDLGLSTTPTVEMAVTGESAAGGIILTASHNPKEWNALKLLNERGEFISAEDGTWILDYVENGSPLFADVNKLGTVTLNTDYMQKHIDVLCAHPLVDVEAIREPLDGADEVEPLRLAHERDRVATLSAAEAVICAAVGRHGERRRLLLVEGAQARVAPADLAQARARLDEVDDVRRGLHGVHRGVLDPRHYSFVLFRCQRAKRRRFDA